MHALVRLVAAAILGLGAALAAPVNLPAPSGLMAFRAVGMVEGGSLPAVTALAQDSEGFLWVGTEDGLFRLEGERFRRFGEEDGLPVSRIPENGLSAGQPRGLWVETTKGLRFWDGTRFRKPSEMGLQGRDDAPGLALAQGGAILSGPGAHTRYLSLGGEPFKLIEGLPRGDGLSAGTQTSGGNLLVVALNRVLWIRDKGQWRSLDLKHLFPEDGIQAVLVDRSSTIWLRSLQVLVKMDGPQGNPQVVDTPDRLSGVNGVSLAEDRAGRFWTNTAHGLIWMKDGRTGLLTEAFGLPKGGAQVVRSDQQGTLWVGGDGVHKLLGNGIWTSWGTAHGLPTDIVWSIHRTRDGVLWAGTSGGLALGDARGWRTVPGTRANQYLSMAEDADGNLWLGSNRTKEQPCTLSLRVPGATTPKPVSQAVTAKLPAVVSLQAIGSELWFATDLGLWRARRKGASLEKIEPFPMPGKESRPVVTALAHDGRGGLWVGSSEGLSHWDGATWRMAPRPVGIKDPQIVSIAPAPGGTAWATHMNAPALMRARLTPSAVEILATYGPPHPLASSLTAALMLDPSGILWLGTSRGLLRWDGTRVERFDRNSGLPTDDCNQNCLWLDPNGDLWVGLSVGLARAQLALREGDQTPPAAVILHAHDGKGEDLLPGGDELRKVPWTGRSLTFRYGPRGSVRTEALTYQVQLAGLEDTWRDTQVPEAHYAGLGAGHYQFQVRTVNSVGEVGPPGKLSVQILPPWWQRTWFRILAICAGAGLIFAVGRWRTSMLRRRNAQLELLVKARTAELEAANEALRETSLTDPLTHLHNRRYLAATLSDEATRVQRVFRTYLDRQESPVGRNEDMILLLIDLDHFKQVNDTYGHHGGDQVLQQAAQALRAVSRSSDTLARWGGEEFLMVAKRSDRTRAAQIAENLCEAVRSHPFELEDGRVLRCTCSVGFASFPFLELAPEAMTWEDTLQIADQCLYFAKDADRDGWVGALPHKGAQPSATALRTDLEALVRSSEVHLERSHRLS